MATANVEKKKWYKKWLVWVLIVLLGIFFISIISPPAPTGTGSIEKKTTTQTETAKTQPSIFKVGDIVIVDYMSFKVNKVSTTEVVGEYIMDTLLGEEADGVFYVVDLTIENQAEESKTMFMQSFVIVDDQGRRFDSDTGAEIYYKEGSKRALIFAEQLQPDLPKTGVKIFDLPTAAKGLKLEIKCCGLLTETAQIDLGI